MYLIPDVLFWSTGLAPASLLLVCWPLTWVKGGSSPSCDIQWVLVGSEKLGPRHRFVFFQATEPYRLRLWGAAGAVGGTDRADQGAGRGRRRRVGWAGPAAGLGAGAPCPAVSRHDVALPEESGAAALGGWQVSDGSRQEPRPPGCHSFSRPPAESSSPTPSHLGFWGSP